MANTEPLDLSEIDPPIWRIEVDGVDYGPYTFGQMQAFVGEDRLVATSRVATIRERRFRQARTHDALSHLFPAQQSDTTAQAPAPATERHMITIAFASADHKRVMLVLHSFGAFEEVMDGVYLVNSTLPTVRMREQLAAIAAPGDKIMISNTQTGKLAWIGFSPQQDIAFRTVWATPSKRP